MKRYIFLKLVLCLFHAVIYGSDGEMPVPTREDLPGADFLRDEIYVGGALWGLINGGADLYYEYGFDRMALQEISLGEEQFRLELYRMNGPQSAFGIYSVSRHGCEKTGVTVAGDCLNKYQYQFYCGNYYLSLINYSGSPEAQDIAVRIGGIIAARTEGGRYMLPELFQHEIFMDHIDRLKVIKGIIGMQNALPSVAPLFQDLDNYQVFYLEMENNDDLADILMIQTGYEWDDSVKAGILSTLGKGGVVYDLGHDQLLVLRSEGKGPLYQQLLKLLSDLSSGH
jgi:hypothetical protein